MPVRSWLYAPGHNERILSKVFEACADAVLLDLEDAVPPQEKTRARAQVREVLGSHPEAWVRVNAPRTPEAEADLAAVAGRCAGIRVPKTESADDVGWVAERAPGVPLTCTIESALGLVRAFEIASHPAVQQLAYGGADLALDLGVEAGWEETLYARSAVVVASRAAGKKAPCDGIFPKLEDEEGLREAATGARRLGYFGKSALHPRQVPLINEVFTPGPPEVEWARRVVDAFQRSGGAATRLEDGEFVDLPIAERARRLLDMAR